MLDFSYFLDDNLLEKDPWCIRMYKKRYSRKMLEAKSLQICKILESRELYDHNPVLLEELSILNSCIKTKDELEDWPNITQQKRESLLCFITSTDITDYETEFFITDVLPHLIKTYTKEWDIYLFLKRIQLVLENLFSNNNKDRNLYKTFIDDELSKILNGIHGIWWLTLEEESVISDLKRDIRYCLSDHA